MKLIFGSRAAKHWYPDFREPKGDTDYITPEQLKSTREHEYHWTPGLQYVWENNKDKTYVDPNFLYTIKVSHAAWNIHWDKTMMDIIFLQKKGCQLDMKLYDILIEDWIYYHGKKKVNLNKPNDYFFDDKVERKYKHDDLHEMLKFGDVPLYKKIVLFEDVALPNKELFEKLSPEDQLNCALEEAYVVATERYLIPNPKMPINHAKTKALKQMITTMTKGWFNLFLIVHFNELVYYKNDVMNAKIKGIIYGKQPDQSEDSESNR